MTAVEKQEKPELPAAYKGLGYHELNAMLNLYGPNGEIQFEADREAAHQYFLQHVNNNTVFFHDLEEKLDYLVEERVLRARNPRPVHDELHPRALQPRVQEEVPLRDLPGRVQVLHVLHAEDVRRQALPGALRGPRLHGGPAPGPRRREARHCRWWTRSSKAASSRPPPRSSTPARRSAASWSPASCCASKTTWSRSAGPSTPRCSCPSAAAAWRSR